MYDQIVKRKYELKARADSMAETRQRIAAAAMGLHETLGPARTTVSAVAERARVQRHTVYRHFPTDESLFRACSAHWRSLHPVPEPEPWLEIADPSARLAVGLDALYRYYEGAQDMLTNIYRDLDLVDSIQPVFQHYQQHSERIAEVLAADWPARGARRRLTRAAVSHVIHFRTWSSLVRDGGMSRTRAIELATAMVEAAVAGARPRR
jgi:AcrR family transcriptional regulator